MLLEGCDKIFVSLSPWLKYKKKIKLFILAFIRNKNSKATLCGVAPVASVSFASKLAFYIHSFDDKNVRVPRFIKISA